MPPARSATLINMWVRRGIAQLAWLVPALVALARPGKRGMVLAVLCGLCVFAWFWLVVPRRATRAFAAGQLLRARRHYRWLAASWWPERRDAARLSLAACAIGLQHDASALLDQLTTRLATLGLSERAALANLRALQALQTGRHDAALDFADAACALRPDVPELAHTRALCLIALDRTDEAIALLELATAEPDHTRHEAERCAALAVAWLRKGERDYARDYRRRAFQFWSEIPMPSPMPSIDEHDAAPRA